MKTKPVIQFTAHSTSGHVMDLKPYNSVIRTTASMLLALWAIVVIDPVSAQVSFTRILEGDIAEDAGHFFGCAWGDYDGDGYPDLYVGNDPEEPRLYHNNGDGSFTRITTGTIATDDSALTGVWGDYDNDGDLDLYVLHGPSGNTLYRNDGEGVFTEETESGWDTEPGVAVSAAWGDYDNDGFLDLFVANAINHTDLLYHNNGDGTAIHVDDDPVTTTDEPVSHGCTWSDYDNDGDLDLFVAGQSTMQFNNNGDGTFSPVTTGAPDSRGWKDTAIAAADYDNDGDFDLVVTGAVEVTGVDGNRLYRNDGNGFIRIDDGAIPGNEEFSICAAWGDYDNDGYQDLFIANEWDKNNFLFHNEGDGTFSQVTEGAIVSDGGYNGGCAWADYDNDGDLDLVTSGGRSFFLALGAPPDPPLEPIYLYRNDGGTNSWIALNLVGTISNASAIGAKVRVRATVHGEDLWQLREVSGGSGYFSQNDLRVHVGLGDATTVDEVVIEWPSGVEQKMSDVTVDQFLKISEPWLILIPGEYAETGRFLGILYIAYAPWYFCYNTTSWLYIPENVVEAGRGWIYAPNVASLGLSMVASTEWGWSGKLSKWMYVTDEVNQAGTGWVYML